jgi:hypothetical protein
MGTIWPLVCKPKQIKYTMQYSTKNSWIGKGKALLAKLDWLSPTGGKKPLAA